MTEGTSNLLAAQVRARRTRRGWSQEHLASVSGVSERTIRRLEAGTAIASLQTLQALANAFEVDVSEFTALLDVPPRSLAATRVHEIATGDEFFADLVGAHFLVTHVEDARDEFVAGLVRQLLEELETTEVWPEISPVSRFDSARAVTETLDRLRDLGWFVAVARTRRAVRAGNTEIPNAIVATLLISKTANLPGQAAGQ